MNRHALLWTVGLVAAAAVTAAASQPPPRLGPPPEGRRLDARDGDVIVVENEDRIRVVRRRHATARVVVDDTRNLVVVLADWAPAGGQPDGVVDNTWRFTIAAGRWPLDARWEGAVVVEEDEWRGRGLTLETPAGLVLFHGGPVAPQDSRGPVGVLRFQAFSGGDSTAMGFDQSERQQLSDNPPPGGRMSFGSVGSVSGGGGGLVWGGVSGGVSGSVAGGTSAAVATSGPQPLRVGGNIRPPRKTRHVDPVMPDVAAQAGVRGIVIVELTVTPEGTVQNPRVLRSIPLLDQAALDAVAQWQFEPTLLNGQPVPVMMTVTVSFPPGR